MQSERPFVVRSGDKGFGSKNRPGGDIGGKWGKRVAVVMPEKVSGAQAGVQSSCEAGSDNESWSGGGFEPGEERRCGAPPGRMKHPDLTVRGNRLQHSGFEGQSKDQGGHGSAAGTSKSINSPPPSVGTVGGWPVISPMRRDASSAWPSGTETAMRIERSSAGFSRAEPRMYETT